MPKWITITAAFGLLLAGAAYTLPEDLVVWSAQEVRPDEAAGLYYLGGAAGGFLYNGSSAALSRVAPYSLLDRNAEAKDYYIVWAPTDAALTASSFKAFASAVALGPEEILVGVERGMGAEILRAVDRRIEFRYLAPVTPVERRYDGEPPPTDKDPAIDAAIQTITTPEYTSYVQTLQDFGTRRTGTPGFDGARDYLKQFFTDQGLNATLFPFTYSGNTYYCVVAERPGASTPTEVVIIGGHFDSAASGPAQIAPGAEDNASGTAGAMAAARAFKDFTFGRTVRYIGFGGEEQGLLGSEAYATWCAQNGQNIVGMLNADMVSYDEEKGARDDCSVAYGANAWLYDYLVGVGALYGNGLIYDHYEWSASDHASFWDAGYPALGTIEGAVGVGGLSSYAPIHTTKDVIGKIQPPFGVRVVRDYAATLAHLAHSMTTGIEEPYVPAGPAVPQSHAFAVYPNPYYYGSNAAGVTFEGLKPPASIEVYDLAGRKVASFAAGPQAEKCVWRPAALAPGLYLYRVAGKDQLKTGKLVVAR